MNSSRAQTLLATFQSHQQKQQQGSSERMDRLVVFVGLGKGTKVIGNQRSTALLQFLFACGSEGISDTLVIVHSKGIHYVRGDGKTVAEPVQIGDDASITQVSSVQTALDATDFAGSRLGLLAKETPLQDNSNFGKDCITIVNSGVESKKYETVDNAHVQLLVSQAVLVKDDAGVHATKLAGVLAGALFKRAVVPQLENCYGNASSRTAAHAAAVLDRAVENPRSIPGLDAMDTKGFEWSYVKPLVLLAGSCEKWSWKDHANGSGEEGKPLSWNRIFGTLSSPSDSFSGSGTAAVVLGIKSNGYGVTLGRTYFLAPNADSINAQTKRAYNFLLSVEEAVRSNCIAGTNLAEVRNKALEQVKQKESAGCEDLIAALPNELGGAGGMLVQDPKLSFSDKGAESGPLRGGQTVVTRCLLLPRDVEGLSGPLLLMNTYHIPSDGTSSGQLQGKHAFNNIADLVVKPVATAAPTAAASSVKHEDAADTKKEKKEKKEKKDKKVKKEEEEESDSDEDEDEDEDEEESRPRGIKTRSDKGVSSSINAEVKRLEGLRTLLKDKHSSWVAAGRPRGGADESQAQELRVFELGRLGTGATMAYSKREDVPSKFSDIKADIELDKTKYALWLPLNGSSSPCVPIHVAAIQKVEVRVAGQKEHFLTITFHSTQEGNYAFRANRTKVFVREATFCGPDSGKFYKLQQDIKELHAQIKAKDSDRKAKQGVVQQGGLKLSGRPERLPQVKCRPAPASGRGAGGLGTEGNLEAHENGFRFAYAGGSVDILYENVKFLIVQPSKNDIMVILHLALRQAILINNKKTEHVQFLAEVMEGTVVTTGGNRRSADEEAEMEEKDAERIRKTNTQFLQYAKKVHDLSGLKVEQPYSGVNFEGSATKGVSNLRGNANVLWSLIEIPFFVLDMSTVECVALERILPGGANFDIAFVHTDYRKVTNVTMVPMNELEKIKDWLIHTKTIYFEAGINITWGTTLKQIRDDVDWVPYGENGGWASMMDDIGGGDDGSDGDEGGSDDDEDDPYSDSDEDYVDSDDSDDEDDDSDYDDSDDDDSDDDDDDSDDDDDDDSDWDDSDSSRPKKKHKAEKKRRH